VNYLKVISPESVPPTLLKLVQMALNLNCLLLSAVTGYLPNPVEDAGRLIYAGYPSATDALLAASSTTVASPSVALASSSLLATSISLSTPISANHPSSSTAGLGATISPLSTAIGSTAISSSSIRSSTPSAALTVSSSVSSSAVSQSSTTLSFSTILSSAITSAIASSSGACSATLSTSIVPIPTIALCPGTPGGTVYGVSFSGTGTGDATPYEIGKTPFNICSLLRLH
jgi:hypothetical protein